MSESFDLRWRWTAERTFWKNAAAIVTGIQSIVTVIVQVSAAWSQRIEAYGSWSSAELKDEPCLRFRAGKQKADHGSVRPADFESRGLGFVINNLFGKARGKQFFTTGLFESTDNIW